MDAAHGEWIRSPASDEEELEPPISTSDDALARYTNACDDADGRDHRTAVMRMVK